MNKQEEICYKWQNGLFGGFYTSLMETISRADDTNLDLLSRAYPDHVSAVRRWRTDQNFADRVMGIGK